jgi:hypothetical protein
MRISGRLDLEAKLFRGLSDLSRLSILEALRTRPRTVSQVVAATGLSQPPPPCTSTASGAGPVDRETAGRFTVYRLKSPRCSGFEAAEQIMRDVRLRIAECKRYEARKTSLHA